MKNVVKMFSIGVMTVLLSFNASLSFSQSKGKTIKNGSIYIGNAIEPKQVAAYGTPAWVFSTVSISFIDGLCALTTNSCVYSINMYTGGLGNAMHSQASEAISVSYLVKNGNVYVWDSEEAEPQDESGYSFVFKIEDGYLMLIKAQEKSLKLGKYVYMSDYNKMKKMSNAELIQVEKEALGKLLRN